MPITLKCPVTRTSMMIPHFGEGHKVLTSPHPLLSLSASELVKVTETSTDKDSHILLCAWLEQLSRIGVAHWNGALEPENFSPRWHEQQLEQIITMCNWLIHNANHPALSVIPQIRITPDLNGENLQSWRETCQSVVGSYSTIFEISETLRIRAQMEAAERLLNDYAIDDSKLSVAARKIRSRKAYLHNSLFVHENQEAVVLVTKVVLAPHLYEVQTLQRTKEFCLEHLNETGIENFNDKQEVIQILDAAMVDKIGMATMLGCGASAQDTEILNGISAKYSIEVDGRTFLNGATPKVTQALQRHASNAMTSEAPIKIYESEPLRMNFKSQLGFQIAHKQWQAQQRGAMI
jgi:hypothetical protein